MTARRLSPLAEHQLRELPVDLRELDRRPEVSAELVAAGMIAHEPAARYARLTERGMLYLLDLLYRERQAALCACGAALRDHNPAGSRDNPETGCRAFTYAAPVYTDPFLWNTPGKPEDP